MALLYEMAQVTPVGRITVVLNILSACRIRKSVLVLRGILFFGTLRLLGLQTEDWISLALENARNGGLGVVACGNGTTSLFDSGDGSGRCAAYDDIDGCGKGGLFSATGEQFYAVLYTVETAGLF